MRPAGENAALLILLGLGIALSHQGGADAAASATLAAAGLGADPWRLAAAAAPLAALAALPGPFLARDALHAVRPIPTRQPERFLRQWGRLFAIVSGLFKLWALGFLYGKLVSESGEDAFTGWMIAAAAAIAAVMALNEADMPMRRKLGMIAVCIGTASLGAGWAGHAARAGAGARPPCEMTLATGEVLQGALLSRQNGATAFLLERRPALVIPDDQVRMLVCY